MNPAEHCVHDALSNATSTSVKNTSGFSDMVQTYMTSNDTGLDGSIHEAMNTRDPRITLDSNRHKWVAVDIEEVSLEALYQDIEADERNFMNAMEAYEAAADPCYKIGNFTSSLHTVKDVLSILKKVNKAYEEKDRVGFFAPIRKAFRTLGDHEDVCNAWLELMPRDAQHFFSVICGGAKLILGAAGKLRKINTAILETMVKIPTLIGASRRSLALDRSSPDLRNYCSALYVAVLRAMTHIIHYYEQRLFPKVFTVLVKQDSFETKLLGVLNAMTRASDMIDKEAGLLSRERGKETNITVKATKAITEGTYERVGEVHELADEIHQKTTDTHRVVEHIHRRLSKSSEEDKSAALLVAALNNVSEILTRTLQMHDFTERENLGISSSQPQKSNNHQVPVNTARRQLLTRLGCDTSQPRKDMRAILHTGLNSTLSDQDTSVYMMQSKHIKNFLRTITSSALLIQGGCHDSGGNRSPLSFVSAKLSGALHDTRKSHPESGIIELHFFCGEHVSSSDDSVRNCPAGLLGSLLIQLLTQFDHFDLDAITELKALNLSDITVLGKIFARLLKQLPQTAVVFCIIDNLSLYVDREREESCERLLDTLIRFTRHHRKGRSAFKLLLTSVADLRFRAVDELDDEDILRLPEHVEREGGYSERKWDGGPGHDIDTLSQI